MGMDAFGKRPTAQVGEYFRNSVWWWHPLADWLVGQFPMLTRKCRYWHSNNGDGLNARQSLKLAEALQGALQEGRVLRYAQERVATLEDSFLTKSAGCAKDRGRAPTRSGALTVSTAQGSATAAAALDECGPGRRGTSSARTT